MLSVKDELGNWAKAQGRRPRIVLYASKEMSSEALELGQLAEIKAICVERGEALRGYINFTMAELSGLPHDAYDFAIVVVARRDTTLILSQQRLEMAGIDYQKIRWLQTGDKGQKKIAILVSRRIDTSSVAVPNPLYVPVRCGAYYDTQEQHIFRGDNTGDNISRYKPYFSEFTVQYWGWKNYEADYYGLCHYRRYLSFANKLFPVNERELIKEQILDDGAMELYGLLDSQRMRKIIEGHDAVLNVPAEVSRIPPIQEKHCDTVWELWEAHDGLFIPGESLSVLMDAIREMEPAYLEGAKEYMQGSLHRGYNCYVLRRELFEELCRFQKHILEGLFVRFLRDGTLRHYPRVCAYMGEILYGIFCHMIKHGGKWRIEEKQLIEFDDTRLMEFCWGGSAL